MGDLYLGFEELGQKVMRLILEKIYFFGFFCVQRFQYGILKGIESYSGNFNVSWMELGNQCYVVLIELFFINGCKIYRLYIIYFFIIFIWSKFEWRLQY